MALKIRGKDERLRRADFVGLATLAGLRAADANAVLDDVLHRLPIALDALTLPGLVLDAGTQAIIAKTLDLCRARIAAFD